jgi:hypothetical protein
VKMEITGEECIERGAIPHSSYLMGTVLLLLTCENVQKQYCTVQ